MYHIWIVKLFEGEPIPTSPNATPARAIVECRSEEQGEEFAGPFDYETATSNCIEFNQVCIDTQTPLWAIAVDENEQLTKGQFLNVMSSAILN